MLTQDPIITGMPRRGKRASQANGRSEPERPPSGTTPPAAAENRAGPGAAGAHDHGRIQLLAYWYWCQRGSPIGSPDHDWLRAEAELRTAPRSPWRPLYAMGVERETR